MTTTHPIGVEKKEDTDDKYPGHGLRIEIPPDLETPTEFTWPSQEKPEQPSDIQQPQPSSEIKQPEPQPQQKSDVDQLIQDTGEFPALSFAGEWLTGAGKTALQRFTQERWDNIYNFYERKKLDPNDILGKVNTLIQTGDIGSLSNVEDSPTWVELPDGRKISLSSVSSERGTELVNTPGAQLIENPNLRRVRERKEEILAYNESSTDGSFIGPTGPSEKDWPGQGSGREDKPLPFINKTFPRPETVGYGSAMAGDFAAYIVETIVHAAILRGVMGKLAPVGTPQGRLWHSPSRLSQRLINQPSRLTKAGGYTLKGASEFAIPGITATAAITDPYEPNFSNMLVNLGVADEESWVGQLKINPWDEQQTAVNKQLYADGLFGSVIGTGGEFGGVALRKLKPISNIKAFGHLLENKAVDFILKTADSLVDADNVKVARTDLQEAKILQEQGPIKNAEPKEVLPTKRVTGKKKTEVEVKDSPIEPKATQKELDIQVEKAEEVLKTSQEKAIQSEQKLISAAKEITPEDLKPKKRLSETMAEDITAIKGSIDKALDTAHRQAQRHLRAVRLEGVETNLIDKTNAHEFPAKAKRSEILDHLTDLDTEFTIRSNDLEKRNRANDNKYGGREWPTEVREKWNADFQDRQALSDRRDMLNESIRNFDAARETNFPAPEDVIKLGGLEKELRDQVAFREWIKDPGDPELKQLFEEIEETQAKHDKHLADANRALEKIDAEMDKLDEILYGEQDITDIKRAELEDIYQGLDQTRQEVKADAVDSGQDSINQVTDAEGFKKWFGDLPMEKQQEILNELRINGAIVSNPTKIGDTPPPIDVVTSKVNGPGIAETMRGLIKQLQESDERLFKKLGEITGKPKEGPIVDVDATEVVEAKALPVSNRIKQAMDKVEELNLKGVDEEDLDINNVLAPKERPEAPSHLNATVKRYSWLRYKYDRANFKSDLDLVVYTVTQKGQSKKHAELLAWLQQDLGIDIDIVSEVGADIQKRIKANKKSSANQILTIEDTEIWKRGGQPKLMLTYHGTGPDEFEKIMKGGFSKEKTQVQLYGPAIYSTQSRKDALRYAKSKGGDESTIIEIDVPEEDLVDMGHWHDLIDPEKFEMDKYSDKPAWERWNRLIRKHLNEGKDVLMRNVRKKDGVRMSVDPNYVLFGSNRSANKHITDERFRHFQALNEEEIANLKEIDLKRQAKLSEEYKKATDPQDPGDQLDPKNKKLMVDLPEFGKGKLGSKYVNSKGEVKMKKIPPHKAKKIFKELFFAKLEAQGISKAHFKKLWNFANLTGGKSELRAGPVRATITETQAADYGLPKSMIGQVVEVGGMYDHINDLSIVAMMIDGKMRSFEDILSAKFHENFHALQNRYLNARELGAFKRGDKEIRELAAKVRPDLAKGLLAPEGAKGRIDSDEARSFAGQGWLLYADEYEKTGWAAGFNKLRKIIEKVTEFLRLDLGLKTWDDVFEEAYEHKFRKRGMLPLEQQRGPYSDSVKKLKEKQKAIQADDDEMWDDIISDIEDQSPFSKFSINPDEIKKGIDENREKIAKGEMSGDDAVKDAAMRTSTRRYKAAKGDKEYIERSESDIIATNKAFEEAINDAYAGRAEFTGLESFKEADLVQKGIKAVQDSGYDIEKTIHMYENARKGDVQSQDDLVAAAGLLHHLETQTTLTTQAAIEWERAVDGVDEAEIAGRFYSATRDQMRLLHAWSVYTRKQAQGLRVAQIKREDALASRLGSGAEVKQTVDEQSSTASIEKGFTPTDGMLGEGVYFSTDSAPGKAGDVELYGRVPEDVNILDISRGAQRITDILDELGLGNVSTGKDGGFVFSPAQQEGIRDYVTSKGYAGIRFGTEYMKNVSTGDQIIIYDTNVANRMIDSDAAQPPARNEEPVSSILENAIRSAESSLDRKLPPGIKEDIVGGNITPEVREILDGLASVVYNIRSTPGFKDGVVKILERVPEGKLDSNAIANLYRNSLFFSVRTWMRATLGSAYRAATLPVTQMLGESRNILKAAVKLDPDILRLSMRRQNLNLHIYSKYFQNLPYAVRMMVASFRENETFVNVGRSQADWQIGKKLQGNEQLELDMMNEDLINMNKGKGDAYWMDPNGNPLSIVKYHLKKNIDRLSRSNFGTFSSRVLGSMDTFHSAMVGPSYEWARLMEIELFKADQKGFEPGSIEAWRWAEERADRILLQHLEDIDLGNGQIIKNGRLKGEHAKNAMDWVNFTDDVSVGTEPRTYDYGVRKAQAEGITDSLKIVKYADQWVKAEIKDTKFRQAGQAVINAPGNLTRMASQTDNIYINTAVAMIRPTNRTPTNLVKSAIRMAPGPNLMVDSYWRDIHSQDHMTKSRAIGEVAIGAVILGFGVHMFLGGNIQMSGPPSQDVRERFEEDRAGRQGWSVRMRMPGGEWSSWWDIEMFDNLANILGAIGAFTENVGSMSADDKETWAGWITVALAGTAKEIGLGIFTKRALGGLSDLSDLQSELSNTDVKVISGSRWEVERYVTNKLAGFWPQFANMARNSIDPVRRQIDASTLPPPLNMIENGLKTIALRTPGLSKTQPPRLHPITGQPITSNLVPGNDLIPDDEPWLKMFHDVIVPWNVTRTKMQSSDPVDVEMLRIQGRGGTFQIWNRRTFNLKNRVLNTTELNKLIEIGTSMKIHGKTLHQALLAKIQDPKYGGPDGLPTDDHAPNKLSRRAIALQEVINLYKNGVKNKDGVTVIKGAKDIFIEETNKGMGTIGYEIMMEQLDNLERNRDAKFGITTEPEDIEALRQLAY